MLKMKAHFCRFGQEICHRKEICNLRQTQKTASIADYAYLDQLLHLSMFICNIAAYIGGFIAMEIIPNVTCDTCRLSLFDKKNKHSDMSDNFILLRIKKNSGLVIPNSKIYQSLHFTENVLRSMVDIL